jgi:hypothetical protein
MILSTHGLKLRVAYGSALVHTRVYSEKVCVIPPLYSTMLAAANLFVIICRQAAVLPVTRTFNLPLKSLLPCASRGEISGV